MNKKHIIKFLLLCLCTGYFVVNIRSQEKPSKLSKTKQKSQQQKQQGISASVLGWRVDSDTQTLPPLPLEVRPTVAKSGQNRYRGIITVTNVGTENISLPFDLPSLEIDDNIYRRDKNVGGMVSLRVKDQHTGVGMGRGLILRHYGNTNIQSSLLTLAPGEAWFVDFKKEKGVDPLILKPGKYILEVDYLECRFNLPEFIHVASSAHAKIVTPPIVFEVKETTILE